jgi:hypothetical protein
MEYNANFSLKALRRSLRFRALCLRHLRLLLRRSRQRNHFLLLPLYLLQIQYPPREEVAQLLQDHYSYRTAIERAFDKKQRAEGRKYIIRSHVIASASGLGRYIAEMLRTNSAIS